MARTQKKKRTSDEETAAPPHKGIRTIAVGFKLLDAVSSAGPSSLREIAQRADLTPSRTHRYLAGLIAAGLVRQDPATGRYEMGDKLVEFGLRALGRVDPVSVGGEMLGRLANLTGLDSHLTVWGSGGPTVIRWQQGKTRYALKVREGRTLSILGTATGRLFLTYLPPTDTHELLQREITDWNARLSDDKRISMTDIERITAAIRRYGLAGSVGISQSEIMDLTSPIFERSSEGEVATLAAPVFGADGSLSMTLTLIGLFGSFKVDLTDQPAQCLRAVAAEFSHRLGARPSTARSRP